MIDKELIENIKQIAAANLKQPVDLILQTGIHHKRNELKTFLTQLASADERIKLIEEDLSLANAISFTLQNAKGKTGIIFSGIPSGHEFNSLILAILQAGGSKLKLDDTIKKVIAKIDVPLQFKTYVSLSCHSCPDVVQALNQFALLSENISHQMIDGALFPEDIERLNIQGVPAVYLNDEPFANGKIDVAQLFTKIIERYPYLTTAVNENNNLDIQDVTVIGGGPAGSAAAIYAARKGIAVTLIANVIGGQVKDTVDIENLISQPKTTGAELAINLAKNLHNYPINIKANVSVKEVQKNASGYQLKLNTGELINSKTIIIASGAKWRELGVPGEKENIGNGVAYCPHCDGPFFKNKNVAVIGGGNSGIEAALDLANIVNHVTVFEFMPELKADKVLIDNIAKKSNVKIITNAATKAIVAENGKVNAIIYQHRDDNTEKKLSLEGVFVQIGLLPNSDFIGDLVAKTAAGEIIIDAKGQTSSAGIFACGDVTTVPYKQIVIAMGEGAKAALAAFDFLMRT